MLDRLTTLDTLSAARWLLGKQLVRDVGGKQLAGIIVETEAYLGAVDMAAHSYNGETPRNRVMFGPPGHVYVYFTYGMHYCMNVVTGSAGLGEAVLIRALEPLIGIKTMQKFRGTEQTARLTNGPAKLTQALKVDTQLNGHWLGEPPLQLMAGNSILDSQVVQTTRVGISRAQDLSYRFYVAKSPFVSQK